MQSISSIPKCLVSSKLVLLIVIFTLFLTSSLVVHVHALNTNQIFYGVDMKGYYTSMAQSRTIGSVMPSNYFADSFKLISQAGMNHVRFIFYWEAYEKDPTNFMLELQSVAQAADKWNVNVIYDNHQFHTSSWFNPQRGTGFPSFLFQNNPSYPAGNGGGPKYTPAKVWWTDWWNRAVVDSNGTDGWTLQAEFFKKIIDTVDEHKSTLGYELLSEPQVHNSDQWEKIGKYNTFMVNELRKYTNKVLVYSMNIPVDLKSPINLTPENIAKMKPQNSTNVVFKISIYGLPTGPYQQARLNTFLKASNITGIPIYVGEWNNVLREQVINEEGSAVFQINPFESDISQQQANQFVKTFKDIGIWGLAYWKWDYISQNTPNFNLISVGDDGHLITNKYFKQLKIALESNYGNQVNK
ncbi:MAG: glycoside hydrolase family 5 protein [Thaumarchaeota archaeon]|nr:MAG: glycoside hydrolase family 5 protein [Nitrososphaerota archaeon]TLX91241.1 MAG: glycoside hydrolase family 5 protein [Nitrososphaerota archaeon]